MASIETNGVTIEYQIHGVGEPMLFVMGLSGQLVDWPDPFLQLFLDEGFQVITFDNRDIGLSSQTMWSPPGQTSMMAAALSRRPLKRVGYTLTDMADDAVGLLDGLGIDSAHIVGVSMGAMIGQEMAINHPHKVKSLCSIMSNTGDRRNGTASISLLAQMAQCPSRFDDPVDVVVETFRLMSGPHFLAEPYRELAERRVKRSWTPAGSARQTAAIMGSRDRTKLLGSISAPTLVIHGLLDRLVKPSGGVATASAIPTSRLLAFPEMAHDLPAIYWPEMKQAIIANTARHLLSVSKLKLP